MALDGNVRFMKVDVVVGDAWAAGGSVVVDGGIVEGQKRSLAVTRPSLFTPHAPRSTWQSAKLVIGWFALLTIIGLGVMVFAEANLDGVVLALERGFSRSFWIGLTGQVAMLPTLLASRWRSPCSTLPNVHHRGYVIFGRRKHHVKFLAIATPGSVVVGPGNSLAPRSRPSSVVTGDFSRFGWSLRCCWNPVVGAILGDRHRGHLGSGDGRTWGRARARAPGRACWCSSSRHGDRRLPGNDAGDRRRGHATRARCRLAIEVRIALARQRAW